VIGVADPSAVTVDTMGTGVVPDDHIEAAVREVFPLSPSGIIRRLGLLAPIYLPAAVHGHFGRIPGEGGPGTFSWEATGSVADLRSAADR
jgi:S-adenosylmethionine synthetase